MSPKSNCFGYKKNEVDIEKIKPKKTSTDWLLVEKAHIYMGGECSRKLG